MWDCDARYQGVSAGWVDQYHQATDGQELNITGIPNATDYYLVTTTNPVASTWNRHSRTTPPG